MTSKVIKLIQLGRFEFKMVLENYDFELGTLDIKVKYLRFMRYFNLFLYLIIIKSKFLFMSENKL